MKANFNLKGLLASVFMMLTVSLSAQQHTVTGTVVDADNGQPLIGVAVIVSTGRDYRCQWSIRSHRFR